MSIDRATLIAAIRQAPEDDALRLAAADWFEEQGDETSVARAEFIRIQVRRASLPIDDPRHSELQARELRLLKRYAAAWCGSHFVFRKVRFRRGFIEYVHLHLRHFLHHRRQILALEPVRDVSLTGWHRAPDDLIRRVAGCAEWKHIETLRIHDQSPRGNLLLLLESPHLTRLRALHCPMVQFHADDRRRFERLPVLRQIEELRLPTLYSLYGWPHDLGDWFCDGGEVFASQWRKLRSLTLPPHFFSMDLLQRVSAMDFWDRLTALELRFPNQASDALSILRERLPPALEDLCLWSSSVPADYLPDDPFFDRLAEAPLGSLRLLRMPIRPAVLARLLDGTHPRRLQELCLTGCNLREEHARVIASAAGTKALRSLSLSGDRTFTDQAARTLFASEHLRSLVHLDVNYTPIGNEGAVALTRAVGWDRLRSLDLSGTGMTTDGLRALLHSQAVRHLNWLALAGSGSYDQPLPLNIPTDVVHALTRLPHLAHLRLGVSQCDRESRQILRGSDSLAWVSLFVSDEPDSQTVGGNIDPGRLPPVDAALEGPFGRG